MIKKIVFFTTILFGLSNTLWCKSTIPETDSLQSIDSLIANYQSREVTRQKVLSLITEYLQQDNRKLAAKLITYLVDDNLIIFKRRYGATEKMLYFVAGSYDKILSADSINSLPDTVRPEKTIYYSLGFEDELFDFCSKHTNELLSEIDSLHLSVQKTDYLKLTLFACTYQDGTEEQLEILSNLTRDYMEKYNGVTDDNLDHFPFWLAKRAWNFSILLGYDFQKYSAALNKHFLESEGFLFGLELDYKSFRSRLQYSNLSPTVKSDFAQNGLWKKNTVVDAEIFTLGIGYDVYRQAGIRVNPMLTWSSCRFYTNSDFAQFIGERKAMWVNMVGFMTVVNFTNITLRNIERRKTQFYIGISWPIASDHFIGSNGYILQLGLDINFSLGW